MPEYLGSRVVARQLVGGYQQALARFAAGVRSQECDPAYFALFESLNWAIAVDDFVRKIWVPDGKPLNRGWSDRAVGEGYVELLDATRYARNLVHHHWADAVRKEQGARYPVVFPKVFHSFVWRDTDELPEHPFAEREDIARNRAAYEAKFAGTRAEDSLRALEAPFALVGTLLDPPRATPPAS